MYIVFGEGLGHVTNPRKLPECSGKRLALQLRIVEHFWISYLAESWLSWFLTVQISDKPVLVISYHHTQPHRRSFLLPVLHLHTTPTRAKPINNLLYPLTAGSFRRVGETKKGHPILMYSCTFWQQLCDIY